MMSPFRIAISELDWSSGCCRFNSSHSTPSFRLAADEADFFPPAMDWTFFSHVIIASSSGDSVYLSESDTDNALWWSFDNTFFSPYSIHWGCHSVTTTQSSLYVHSYSILSDVQLIRSFTIRVGMQRVRLSQTQPLLRVLSFSYLHVLLKWLATRHVKHHGVMV